MPDFSYPILVPGGGGVFTTVPDEMFPVPEVTFGSVANRVAQPLLEGGPFFMRKNFLLNRLVFRVNAFTGAPTGKILIYQAPNAEAGIANLVASFTAFPVTAVANKVVAPDQGSVFLKEGLIFILIGRDSALGSFTHRCWTAPSSELIATAVDTDTHPMYFTTGIAAAAASAPTFNPRQSPGGSALATLSAVAPVVRLKRV